MDRSGEHFFIARSSFSYSPHKMGSRFLSKPTSVASSGNSAYFVIILVEPFTVKTELQILNYKN